MTMPGAPALSSIRHHWAAMTAVVLTLVWVIGTHLPRPDRVGIHVGRFDWLAHGFGYAILTACWLIWCLSRPGAVPARTAAVVWGAMIVFAAADELTQPLAGRSAQWSDWVADTTGAAAVAILSVARRRPRGGGSSRE